jgi:membrane protease YdiL (CAAX protease family)
LFCFAAGFGEELLFRGIVQQQLELLVGISPAAIAVAVGFGCVFLFLYFLWSDSRGE